MTDPDATPVEDDARQPVTAAVPEPAGTDHPTGTETGRAQQPDGIALISPITSIVTRPAASRTATGASLPGRLLVHLGVVPGQMAA